jgi:hypothetical protein
MLQTLEFMDKNLVPALNNHDDEVGDHAGVHKPQKHDHQGLHVHVGIVTNEMVVVYEESPDVNAEGRDES